MNIRVAKFMTTPVKDLPDGLKSFINYRNKRFGVCSETVIAAIEQYCEDVPEGEEWEHDNFDKELERRDTENDELEDRISTLEGELAEINSRRG